MLMHYDEVRLFIGVVEDRMDPLQQGRVRVRAIGVHPFSRIQGDISGIPVEDLPWMSVVLPVTTASVAGVSGAVTGLVQGSSVIGLWLDKYKTNGIVIGSYSGNQVKIPNSDEGFSDPSGQYPDYAGPDTSALNAGGAYGDTAGSNARQNSNSSTGLWPGGADISGPDDNPNFTIEKMLRGDEGLKNTVYWDTLGYPTIGIGHLIMYKKTKDMSLILRKLSQDLGHSVGATISQSDISKLFMSDLGRVQAEIKKHRVIGPTYIKMNRSRQMALENMAFQLGTGGLGKFKNVLALMLAGQYDEAAKSAKQSLWARQTPGRANRICLVIKNGNLGAYGVVPKKVVGKSLVSRSNYSSDVTSSFNPYDPSDTELYPDVNTYLGDGIEEDLSGAYVREPSNTLFVEPSSSYQGEYPYIKASVTEGGHSQEFDDTPGHERYKLMHPTGSYVEVAPDGRKTDKCTGDYYTISEGTRNSLTSGDFNVNVGGIETYINFADVIRQIEGNIKTSISGNSDTIIEGNETTNITGNSDIVITGNETKKITGDGTIEVSGNVKIVVTGNANIEVSSNAEVKVGGNLTTDVSGNYELNCSTYTVNSSGVATIAAPRVDLG